MNDDNCTLEKSEDLKNVEHINQSDKELMQKKQKKIKKIIFENSIGVFHVGLFIFMYLSNFSYVAWGALALSKDISIINECFYVWIYDFIGILYAIIYIINGGYTFAVTLKFAKSINDMSNINNSTNIDHVFIPVLLTWGLIILCSISDDCLNVYLSGHRDVWDLCQGTFYGILSMILLFVFFEIYISMQKKLTNRKKYKSAGDVIQQKLLNDGVSY